MKNCFLHIGSHKTGTSAIQKFLFESESELSDNGFFYPKSCKHDVDFSHNKLGLYLIDKNNNFQSLLNELDEEIKNNQSKNIIISSEVLEKSYISSSDYLLYFFDFIKQKFNTINLIYCVRDPIDHCNSVFKQFVAANMWTKSADEFVPFFLKITFSDIITAWSKFDQVQNIFVYWYSEDFEENLNKFEKITNINFKNKKSPGRINKSLDGKFLEFQYFYNLLCKDNICEFDKELSKKIRESNATCKNQNYYCNNIVKEEFSKVLDAYSFDFCCQPKCVCVDQRPSSNKKYDKIFMPPKNIDEFINLSQILNIKVKDLSC